MESKELALTTVAYPGELGDLQIRSKRWRIFLLPIAGLLIFLAAETVSRQNSESLYASPQGFGELTKSVSSRTFQINCNGDWSGSGWGLELSGEYFVVTAQHVVRDCLTDSRIYARNDQTSVFEVFLVAYDGRYWSNDFANYRDLALLKSNEKIATFELQRTDPAIGQWVLVAGYPADSELVQRFSLTTGRITSVSAEGFLVTDAAINEGNSGAPMINSSGEVVGTIFASEPTELFENMGYAQSLKLHCDVILECSSGRPDKQLVESFWQFDSER